jgi:hypothetical protein
MEKETFHNSICRWLSVVASFTTLLVVSCKEDSVAPEPQNSPPVVNLSVTPLTGQSPLTVRIIGNASDPDGASDITLFNIVIKNNVTTDSIVFTKNPTDTTITLTNILSSDSTLYSISAKAVDKKGASDSKGPLTIIVRKKPIPPIVTLNVTPLFGTTPLDVRIQASATDLDSISDIISFRIVVKNSLDTDSLVFVENPTDTTLTFVNQSLFDVKHYTISARAIDRSGKEDVKTTTVAVSPVPNNPPTSMLDVTPLKGIAPVEVRIRGSALDPDGNDDIMEYKIVVHDTARLDSIVLTANPTDTTLILEKSFTVYSRVIDRRGAYDVKGPLLITVHQPIVAQRLYLQNFADIRYRADIANVSSVIREILKNDNIFQRDTLLDSGAYEEVFSAMAKGIYTFILRWKYGSRDTSTSTTIEVPNYLPTATSLVAININFDEESSLQITVPAPRDNNPEDNPVPYRGVQTIAGAEKLAVSFDSSTNDLTLQGNVDMTGSFTLRFEFGSDTGGVNNATKGGTIYDMLDIEGFLEDNEKHQRASGTIKVYNESNLLLGEIQVPNNGIIKSQLNQRISDLTNTIYIQGRRIQNSGADTTSYIRTIRFAKGNIRNLEMVVVPYDSLSENGITKENFRRHVQEVTSSTDYPPTTENPNIYKWNFGENTNVASLFKEIIISKRNPGILNPADTAFFNDLTMDTLKQRILDTNDIGSLFRGKINDPNKIILYNGAWPRPSYPNDNGRLVIYPSKYHNDATILGDYNSDSYIDMSRDRLLVDSTTGNLRGPPYRAPAHEIGHSSGMWSHAWTVPREKTIMGPISVPSDLIWPLFADRKTAKILYENSYATDKGAGNSFLNGYRLRFDDLMGLSWK